MLCGLRGLKTCVMKAIIEGLVIPCQEMVVARTGDYEAPSPVVIPTRNSDTDPVSIGSPLLSSKLPKYLFC